MKRDISRPAPEERTDVAADGALSAARRESNLELLRIIAMLLIIAHHYVVNLGLTSEGSPLYANILSWRSQFLLIFGAWGKIALNCFVMITAYFMCTRKITLARFVKLLAEVMFYRIVIGVIFLAAGYTPLSAAAILKLLLPVTSVTQNFTGCFLIFYLCIPFLNILVQRLTEKQHLRAVALCAFIYVLFGTLPRLSVSMNYVSWYIVLYFIASYIRLYPKKLFVRTGVLGWLTLAAVALCALSVTGCSLLGTKIGARIPYALVSDANTFLAVTTAVLAFLFFKSLKMRSIPFINTVASATFGVLLIHANSDAMRGWLWRDTLHNVEMYSHELMPLHAAASVVGIMIICTVIDLIRIRFLEKPFLRLCDKRLHGLSERWGRFEQNICARLGVGQESASDGAD